MVYYMVKFLLNSAKNLGVGFCSLQFGKSGLVRMSYTTIRVKSGILMHSDRDLSF